MLLDLITAHRDALIARKRLKVAATAAPTPTERAMETGAPLFLDQLAQTLRRQPPEPDEGIESAAATHAAALLGLGYTVAQVVHDYGEICQAITELAVEVEAPITTEEFHTLNLSLDNAIAGAITEYARLREETMSLGEAERAGVLAHELRNRISGVKMAFQAIRSGRAPLGGSVATVLLSNLDAMTALIDRALLEVRVDSGIARRQRIRVRDLIEEAEIAGSMAAELRGISLVVTAVDHRIEVDADPQILSGVIANLVQNALKFTPAGGRVSLTTRVVGDRVRIEVEDECGGIPLGKADELFRAFQQHGKNRDGLGLGLFISRKGVEATGGVLAVRDLPGTGCVFTIDLLKSPSVILGHDR